MFMNRGEIENRGIEASINAILLDKNDFTVSVTNIAFNKTKLKNLGLPPSSILIDGSYQSLPFYQGNNVSRGNIFGMHPMFSLRGTSRVYSIQETDGIYQLGDILPGGGIARIYDPLTTIHQFIGLVIIKLLTKMVMGLLTLRIGQ